MRLQKQTKQKGVASTNVIVISTVSLALVFATLVQTNQIARFKAKGQETEHNKRRLDAALKIVQQAINTGTLKLYYDATSQGYRFSTTGDATGVRSGDLTSSSNPCYISKPINPQTDEWRICKTDDSIPSKIWSLGTYSAPGKVQSFVTVWICENDPALQSALKKDSTTATDTEKTLKQLANNWENIGCAKGQKGYPVIVTFGSITTDKNGYQVVEVLATTSKNHPAPKGSEATLKKDKLMLTTGTKAQDIKDAFVNNTDYCYFMRPVVDGGSVKTLKDLKPRPEKGDTLTFEQEFTIKEPPKEHTIAYEHLPALREKIFAQAKSQSLRGAVLEVIDIKQEKAFMGVEPNKGAQGGPQFQYYLARQDQGGIYSSVVKHTTTWNPNYVSKEDGGDNSYKAGCRHVTSGYAADADFCTRVDIPYKEYKTTLKEQCVKKEALLTYKVNKKKTCSLRPKPQAATEAQQNANANSEVQEMEEVCEETVDSIVAGKAEFEPSVQISCHPDWPDTILKYIKEYEQKEKCYNNTVGCEILAQEASYLLDYDVEKVQQIAQKEKFKPYLEKATQEILKKIQQSGGTLNTQTNKIVYEAKNRDITVTYYEKVPLDRLVTIDTYTSRRCGYFIYWNAKDPRTCRIEVFGKEDGWWVCRTADGCFEENTRIRLADGSEKRIVDLKPEDWVWNPKTQKAYKIKKLTVGPEKETTYRIFIDNRSVWVTKTHPFYSTLGWVKAEQVFEGMKLLDADGTYREVTKVELLPAEQTPIVANILLDADENNPDDHFVLANGIVTGDLLIQNQLEQKK